MQAMWLFLGLVTAVCGVGAVVLGGVRKTQRLKGLRPHVFAAPVVVAAIVAAAIVMFSGSHPTAATAPSVDETSPSNVVSGLVNSLASQSFPSAYSGTRIDGPREITVLVARPDPGLVAAVDSLIARENASLGSVVVAHYARVEHSLQQLRDLTMRLAQDDSSVASAGFPLDYFGPDTASNTVSVTLQPPTTAAPNYIADAQAFFDDRYGSGLITVEAITDHPATAVQYHRNRETSFFLLRNH
jgi:hypothetical protein